MNKIIEIPIHFDLKENKHYIPIDDFVYFSNDVKNIIDEFSKSLFGDSFRYQVVVLPPENGTFLKKIGIISLSVGSFITGAGFGDGFIEGLTGHDLKYYGRNAGVLVRDLAISFLEKDENKVKLDNPTLISSKNNFYERCINNDLYLGVEFSNVFSDKKINRDNFLAKINKQKDDPQSEYKLHEVIIVSPVNIKNNTTQWKTKDKRTGNMLSFYMQDRNFLNKYLTGNFPLKETDEDDIMIVMVEYKKKIEFGVEKIDKRNAIKVYKINEIELDKIPEDKTIEGVLESVEKIKNSVSEKQDTLFSLFNDNKKNN